MNEQFISDNFCDSEISQMLKEVGFNEPCLGFYDEAKEFHEYQDVMQNQFIPFAYCTAPLYQQACAFMNRECPKHQRLMFLSDMQYGGEPVHSFIDHLKSRIGLLKAILKQQNT